MTYNKINKKLMSNALQKLFTGFNSSENWDEATIGFYNNGKTKTLDLKNDSVEDINKFTDEVLEEFRKIFGNSTALVENDNKDNAAKEPDLPQYSEKDKTDASIENDLPPSLCDDCDKKDVCDLISSEYQYDKNKFADDTYTDIKNESVNDLYIEKTEDSKTKISPTTTLKQTFYLISEIYNNSPLFEVHVIDLTDNFCQYIDICRPKYKSAIINIEDKSNGTMLYSIKDTVPIIFESSYLGTFNKNTLSSIEEYYKYGREIYLYNPITLQFYCISSGDNDESGLPKLDIEKYGFKKASKVEESLLFEYSKTKW